MLLALKQNKTIYTDKHRGHREDNSLTYSQNKHIINLKILN